MKVRAGLEVASLTDVGCQRENNEDSFRYWEPEEDSVFNRLGRLAVIADGMGGAEGGQFASRIAVESVQELYSSADPSDPQQRLVNALHLANSRVLERARKEPALHGMGTTLTAMAIVGNNLYFAHTGDSRLYLIRKGSIRPLTRDHSLVARLVESGVIRPEEADAHPQRHVLTAAVGVTDVIEPDVPPEPVQLEKNDVLLLCTDGLWGQMSESEIAQTISSHNIEDAARVLVQLAKDHGGPDNITLQILRID
ncbi:MAG TPA: Stp1/IreP family PP2C-type Ser/Thr phosphatase [Terriglobales bacterium]|jgi:protein phosphatase